LSQERVVTSLKAKIVCLVPLMLGVYCLVEGLVLLGSEDPIIPGGGISLLLWLPACGYYAWRGRTAFARRAKVAPEPRRVVTTAMAPVVE
jgi:hypothetical protein